MLFLVLSPKNLKRKAKTGTKIDNNSHKQNVLNEKHLACEMGCFHLALHLKQLSHI